MVVAVELEPTATKHIVVKIKIVLRISLPSQAASPTGDSSEVCLFLQVSRRSSPGKRTDMIPMDVIRDLTVKEAVGPNEDRHIAAASSLVRLQHTLHVVADDLLKLAVFPAEGRERGYTIDIFDGELPDDPDARKDEKPDLEACTLLPPCDGLEHGGLLVMGSGSGDGRDKTAVVVLGADESPSDVLHIDASGLFSALAAEVDHLNIEGAACHHGKLHLLQRGEDGKGPNGRIELDLDMALRSLLGDRAMTADPIQGWRRYDLGELHGVGLSFSDLSPLEDGRMVFSASAERDDGLSDGLIEGSALGIMDASCEIISLEPVDRPIKIEGITARLHNDGIEVLAVTDSDDPKDPTPLLRAHL